jgi:spore coat polysaccharide biosynthesis predicted glycosyltransferase SpsG
MSSRSQFERRVAVRVDGGGRLGLGNVYRSLSFVHEMVALGMALAPNLRFWVGGEDTASRVIRDMGFDTDYIGPVNGSGDAHLGLVRQYQPDIVIVDVPAQPNRTAEFFQSLRAAARPFLVNLSDENTGRHEADLVVEGDIYHAIEDTGSGQHPRYLRGVRYCLLNPVFAKMRKDTYRPRKGVLICFGGSDPENLTARAARALADMDEITLIVGKGAQPAASYPPHWRVLHDVTPHHLAGLMGAHALGIISGGLMQYEAACLGLPCLVIAQNAGQIRASQAFTRTGVHHILGEASSVQEHQIRSACESWINRGQTLEARGRRGMALVDGLGTARVVAALRDEVR